MIYELHKIYPNSKIVPLSTSVDDIQYISISNSNEQLIIEKSTLSNSELKLITLLQGNSINSTHHEAASDTSWKQFLLEQGNIPNPDTQSIRCVYILSNHNDNLWHTTLRASLSDATAFIHTTSLVPYITIVFDADIFQNSMESSLQPLIQTLDNDFSTQTSCYVGQTLPINTFTAQRYQDEVSFVLSRHAKHTVGFHYVNELLLSFLGHQLETSFPFFNTLHSTIHTQREYRSIIKTLFEQGGNMSQAADSLYIHRNTLLYRCSKFTKETGFDLQKLSDLTLCYLIAVQ